MHDSSNARAPDAVRIATRCRRQDEILEQAIRLFAEHGYADTDTQMLADQLKVGKGTLYRYFASKEDLFLAAVDFGMLRMREYIDGCLPKDGDPLDRIRAGVQAYFTFFAEHPELVELWIQERALFKNRRKPTYFRRREEFAEQWQAIYRRLIADGRVRPIPPERITTVMGDLLYGTMFTNLFAGRILDPRQQAADLLAIVWRGILTPAEQQRLDAAEAGQSGASE